MTTTTLPVRMQFASRPAAGTTSEGRRTNARVMRKVLTAPLRIVLLIVSTVAIILVALLQGVAFLAIAGTNALGESHRPGSRR